MIMNNDDDNDLAAFSSGLAQVKIIMMIRRIMTMFMKDDYDNVYER